MAIMGTMDGDVTAIEVVMGTDTGITEYQRKTAMRGPHCRK